MRIRIIRIAGVLCALAVVAGCGATAPAKQAGTRVEPASSGQGYDFRKEGRVPPPSGGQARPETDVEEIALDDSRQVEVADAEAPREVVPPPPPTSAAAVVDGFRIQVFASADRDVAQNARAVAAERLGLPAYLDLEGGVYKVRVGDFSNRDAANAALATVRGQHYPDAWVVPARVNSAGQ
jgi:hypothetical protein